MPPRSVFDILHTICRGHEIQKVDYFQRRRAPKREMMKPWFCTICGHIMDVAFKMHPCFPKPFAVFILGVFGDAKAKTAVKGYRFVHISAKAVEMTNTKGLSPL